MSGSAVSPRVAWGINAMALALAAKTGKRVTLADVAELAALHVDALRDCDQSAHALVRFVARVGEDPIAAGAGLTQFLQEWTSETFDMSDRPKPGPTMRPIKPRPPPTPARAIDESPPKTRPIRSEQQQGFDWQSRADTGID